MPKIDKATDDDGTEQAGFGIWTILKIPTIAIAALSVATTSMSLGFVSATLEPHIRRVLVATNALYRLMHISNKNLKLFAHNFLFSLI